MQCGGCELLLLISRIVCLRDGTFPVYVIVMYDKILHSIYVMGGCNVVASYLYLLTALRSTTCAILLL